MKRYICSTCHQHFMGVQCENCSDNQRTHLAPKRLGLALLLGLGLSACAKNKSSTGLSDELTGQPAVESEEKVETEAEVDEPTESSKNKPAESSSKTDNTDAKEKETADQKPK